MLLLGVEARLAKTDATLLLTCLVGFGVLARLWFAAVSPATAQAPGLGAVLAFWVAMGAGILVKGPITALIVSCRRWSCRFASGPAAGSRRCDPGSAC